MQELINYLDKEIRLTYERNGVEQGIRGKLRTIKEDKLLIGGVWVPMPKFYKIEETEYRGS